MHEERYPEAANGLRRLVFDVSSEWVLPLQSCGSASEDEPRAMASEMSGTLSEDIEGFPCLGQSATSWHWLLGF